MIRNLFVFLNILPFIFLFNSTEIAKEKLKVELNAPSNIQPNSSFEVEIKITGGQVSGFAKYVDVLPEGFSAEQLDVGDATFTADNGQVKILWVSFPEDDVTLRFKVTANEKASNSLTLGGKFSYLENNEKKTYSIFKKTVSIGAEMTADNFLEENKAVASVVVERRVLKPRDNVHEVELTIKQSGIEGFAKIQEFVPFGATIEKGETKNAAYSYVKNKVKFVWMSIPAEETFKISYYVDLSNADVKDIKTIEGDFSYLENDASKKIDVQFVESDTKILASAETNAPSQESVPQETITKETENKVETKSIVTETAIAAVIPKSEMNSNNNDSNDEPVAVVEDDKAQKGSGNNTSLENEVEDAESEIAENIEPKKEESNVISNKEIIDEPLASESTDENEIPEEKIEVVSNDQVVASQSNKATSDKVEEEVLVNSGSGVMYKVQIAAGHRVVDAEYFKKRHNFESDFSVENHEGWVKYTTGTYNSYKVARNSRVSINESGHKFNGPFVTAYNQGERITVQEALMISNQKWFK